VILGWERLDFLGWSQSLPAGKMFRPSYKMPCVSHPHQSDFAKEFPPFKVGEASEQEDQQAIVLVSPSNELQDNYSV
jgi:hypothetical protein